jgi:DNA repair ATPase RecN
MNPTQEFNCLYTDISDSIATAMAEIADIRVEHKDGKQELSKMMEKLRGIQARFDDELGLLEQHAEWDRFTMAFFGETNAGKSTIIESLRILFKEDSRQQLLQQNAHDLKKYEEALTVHVNDVRESINRVYAEYAAELVVIKQSIAALTRVQQEESSARIMRKLWMSAVGGFSVGCVVVGTIAMLT